MTSSWGRIPRLALISIIPAVIGAFIACMVALYGFAVLVPCILLPAVFLVTLTKYRYRVPIYCIAIYVPVQDFLMNFAFVELRVFIRFGVEAYLALVVIILFFDKIFLKRERFKYGGLLLPISCFLIISLLSALYNKSSFVAMGVSYYPLLRYFFLVYLVVLNSDFDVKDGKRLFNILLVVVLAQCVIAYFQFWGGAHISGYFHIKPAMMGGTTLGKHVVVPGTGHFAFGTLGRYNILGLFLFVFAALSVGFVFAGYKRFLLIISLVCILIALALTSSRQSWLALLAATILSAYIKVRSKTVLVISLLLFVVIAGLMIASMDMNSEAEGKINTYTKRLKEPFQEQYLATSYTGNRLFYMLEFPVMFVRAGYDRFLLGFGPGTLGERYAEMFGATSLDTLNIPRQQQRYVNDVAYAYILGQVGLAGLCAFVWIIIRLLIHSRRQAIYKSDSFVAGIRLVYPGIIAGMIVSCFFGPNFEIRAISLYIWLLAAFVTKFYTEKTFPEIKTAVQNEDSAD